MKTSCTTCMLTAVRPRAPAVMATRKQRRDAHLQDLAGTPSRNFGEKRECREKGCKVILSRYNPGNYCSQHDADEKVYQKGFKPTQKTRKYSSYNYPPPEKICEID